MKIFISRSLNFLMLSLMLPVASGCTGGGGSASALGSLFGASSSGSTLSLSGGELAGSGAASLAAIHQPEPATMLLVGGGMIAMGYFRNQKLLKNR